MSAGVFILILVVAIAALVLMIVKAKMHPVLALFIAALGTGIALGYGVTGSVDYISNGFGGTLGSVGITIILGAIISMAIEDTGAANEIPLGRLTSVEDVANAVLYLASDEASFLNGVNLPIDGGVTCY